MAVLDSRFEEVVDRFEQGWSDRSREAIARLLADAGLNEDALATAELVRIDIQRRYAVDLPVELRWYLPLIPSQDDRGEVLHAIAYEDFRSRQACGHPCLPERWMEIPGVASESWYRGLIATQGFNGSTRTVENGSDSISLTQFQSPQSSVESVIRDLGFTPVRQIGQGAFSRVFLARQDSLANRYVVIKAVKQSFDEAERLAELQHTNIVPIYSFHRCGQWSLLCMPYAGLVTLADYFDATPDSNLRSGQSFVSTIQCARDVTVRHENTPDAEPVQVCIGEDDNRRCFEAAAEALVPLPRDALVLWFFSRIADALHHAHVRGILHGDIKPANLLIRNDGEPALLDFNLSQKFDTSEPKLVGGTLPYMSPESMRSFIGSSSPISVESDIYGLGVVFYQFLTGRLAYPAPRSAATMDLEFAITQREVPVTWEDGDAISPAISAIVEKCLAPSVAQRYSSAEQLLDDLECERLNLPLKHAREHSLRHRARKWIARHPRSASAASVMAVASVIILAMTLVVWRIAQSNETLAAARTFQRFEASARDSSAQLLSIGRTGKDNAIKNAKLSLATYGVLEDDKWQELNAWSFLNESDKQTALSLMTNLMLKISWVHIESDAVAATETSDTKKATEQETTEQKTTEQETTALRSINVLTQEPFVSQAPYAIELLSDAMNQQTPVRSISRNFASESTLALSFSPLDRIGLAARYIEQGNGEAAIRLLPASLLREIDAYTYWITLGRTQMLLSDFRGAELSFSLAAESYPASAAAFHYRGVCRMKMRNASDTQKALTDFSSALERQPDAFESLTNRAMAREVLGDFVGAVTDLETLINRDPNDARALIIQSRIFRKQNDQRRAKQALEAGLRSHPTTVPGWISLALARLPLDKHGALRDLLHAQRLSPNSVEVLQNLAHVYSEHLQESENAISALNRLLEINPEFEQAMLGRAVLHARSGNTDAAIKDLDNAKDVKIELSPPSLYQAACVFAQLLTHSDRDEETDRWKNNAFGYLSAAFQTGYGAQLFESDPDLSPLREDARFQSAQSIIRAGQGFLKHQ